MKASAILADLDERIAALRDPATAAIRGVRREVSRALCTEPSALVLAVADDLIERDDGYDRFIAYELVAAHPGAMGALGPGREVCTIAARGEFAGVCVGIARCDTGGMVHSGG